MTQIQYHNHPKINRFSVFVCCRMPVVIARACAVLSAVCVGVCVDASVVAASAYAGSSDRGH